MAGFAGSESVYVVPILLADLPFGIGKYSRFLPKASCSQIEFCRCRATMRISEML